MQEKIPKLKTKTVIIILVVIIVALVGVGGFAFYKYWDATHNTAQQQAKQLADYVASVADVPSETPTVATIVDATKLSNQTLKSRSQNGDKLLIYTQSKRLILYRPSTKKIVEMLSIQLQSNEGSKPDKSTNQ